MQEHYTKAVLELLEHADTKQRVDDVLSNLKSVLKTRGHERLLPSILRGVIKRLEHAPASPLRITLAKATERELQKYEAAIAAGPLPVHTDDAVLEEDPSIIGGFKLSDGERMIDQSYKSQLLNLYRRITT